MDYETSVQLEFIFSKKRFFFVQSKRDEICMQASVVHEDESDPSDDEYWSADSDCEKSPMQLEGFYLWTSLNGTMWYLPSYFRPDLEEHFLRREHNLESTRRP